MESKVLTLLLTLLIPLILLPLLFRRWGLTVPRRKWAVWYFFWILLASLILLQISVMKHVLVVKPSVLEFPVGQDEGSVTVANNGTGVIKWSVKIQSPWIEVSPLKGAVSTNKEVLTVRINRSAIPPGVREGSFVVDGKPFGNVTVVVRVS